MINLQDYEKKALIEKGFFGEVYEIIEKKTNKKYAAKIYFSEIKEESGKTVDTIKNELKIISEADFPSIIKFIGYNLINFENEPKPTIIMELATNGSLKSLIDSPQKPPEWNATKKIINIYGIASGMSYLHSKSIIHRDLKPGNILLDEFLFPKITDFNISKISADIANVEFSSAKGTPLYMSPEAHLGEYSYANDVYAFSIIIYEILTGITPFQNLTLQNLQRKVIKEGFIPTFDPNFPQPYKDLILKCGLLNSAERPKFSDIVQQMEENNEFILEGVDVEQYKNYIEFIKKYRQSSNKLSITAQFNDFFKQKNALIQQETHNAIQSFLYPYELMLQLNEQCQQLVKHAESNPEIRYLVGKYSIENQNGFPMNAEIGIQYLKKSMNEGCIRANLYYSQMLIKGEIVRKDLKKAKKCIEKVLGEKNAEAYSLYGIILKKEKDFDKAKKYFLKAIDGGNGRAMYKYAKMLFFGDGCHADKKEAYLFFKMAERNCYKKAAKFIKLIEESDQKEEEEEEEEDYDDDSYTNEYESNDDDDNDEIDTNVNKNKRKNSVNDNDKTNNDEIDTNVNKNKRKNSVNDNDKTNNDEIDTNVNKNKRKNSVNNNDITNNNEIETNVNINKNKRKNSVNDNDSDNDEIDTSINKSKRKSSINVSNNEISNSINKSKRKNSVTNNDEIGTNINKNKRKNSVNNNDEIDTNINKSKRKSSINVNNNDDDLTNNNNDNDNTDSSNDSLNIRSINIIENSNDNNRMKKMLHLKVIMLGASGVGKSSLLDAICNRDFNALRIPTFGISIERVHFSHNSESNVELLIWDTFGQERFEFAIPPNTYRNADAAFVCYAKHFEEETIKWIDRVKEYSPECKIFLIETKSDKLDEQQRNESQDVGKRLIKENNCYMYVLTSAKTREGIQNLLKFAGNLSAANSIARIPESVNLISSQTKEIYVGKNNKKCNC